MAGHHVDPAKTMTYWNTAEGAADVKKDTVLIVGALTCVALGDIPAGGSGELAISEQWRLPKGDAAIDQGAQVYWDAAAQQITTTAVAGRAPCYVLEPATAEDERVCVLLNGR